MRPIVHIAYTAPRGASIFRRVFDKGLAVGHLPPLYRAGWDPLISWQHPIRAPHSITHNLMRSVRARGYGIRLYSLYEHTVAHIRPGDIFIGQPLPSGGMGATRTCTDDLLSVTSRTIREYPSERNFIIMPYAHDDQYSTFAKDLIRTNNRAGGGAIFIGGKIWERDWAISSPFADLGTLRKLHVTEMGIDPTEYPLAKTTYNPKGRRRYLYIGHTAWYKNTKELENIASRMRDSEFAHIGGGEVKGWMKLANFASLTPGFVSELARRYDIFVNVSTADPQATTILEQMCFGFTVACTPETGYEYETLSALTTHDTDYNVKILRALQVADETELQKRARLNRSIAETQHGWGQFTRAILDFVGI